MIKFTVETTSKNLTELLTAQQVTDLTTAKRGKDFQIIIQVIWSQPIHIGVWIPATLNSYKLFSWNEKEDIYPNLKSVNLIADWANNTDVRIITT